MNIIKKDLKFASKLSKRKSTEKIILHCSATKEGENYKVEQIHQMHLKLGWSGIGYNYYIDLHGDIYEGRPEWAVGAHTTGYNHTSIGICYCGGLDLKSHPKDTRNDAQLKAMEGLIRYLLEKYPSVTIHGHREFAAKACPCFDVKSYIESLGI